MGERRLKARSGEACSRRGEVQAGLLYPVTCGKERMMSDEGENGYCFCPRRGTKSSKASLTTPVIAART